MPKYKEIAISLKKRIDHGEFKDSEKLPTERDLIAEYNVSKNTIRNAINILVNLGVLIPIHGSGIYIRKKRYDNIINMNNTRGFASEHPGNEIKRDVLSVEVILTDEFLAEIFNVGIGEKMYFIKRVMIIDGEPFAVEYTYYLKELVPYLNKEIAEKSIFGYLMEDLNLQIGYSEKYISSEQLSGEDNALLKLDESSYGLVVEDSTYLSNGRQFNYSKIWYNPKYIHLFVSDR